MPSEPHRRTWRERLRRAATFAGWDGGVLGLRNPVLCVVAAAIMVSLASTASRLYHGNVVDDAAISMVYARNLARGDGLVFNLGERVEGYTNFLWVVAEAACFRVSRLVHGDFERSVIETSIACGVIDVVLTYLVALRLWRSNYLATALALALLVLDNSFTTWAALGLEGHFLALWLLLALLFVGSPLPRRGALTGLCVAGASLTRPDAALFGVVLVLSECAACAVAWRRRRAELSGELRQLAALVACWVGVFGAYYAWRWQYYGYPFPNTYYLKLGAGKLDGWHRGLEYVRAFLELRGWLPVLAVVGLLGVAERRTRVVLGYLAVHVTYVAYVGGDFFPGHRFFVAQLPLFALAVAVGLDRLWQLVNHPRVAALLQRVQLPPHVFAGATAVTVGALVHGMYVRGVAHGPLEEEVLRWHDDLSGARRLMTWLRDRKPPGASIATGLIGHAGLFSEARVIDLYGVVDLDVAHSEVKNFGQGKAGHEKKPPLSTVLARQPTYIVPGYIGDDFWERGYYLDEAIPKYGVVHGLWTRDSLPELGQTVGTQLCFERGQTDGWVAVGTSFEHWPATVVPPKHEPVVGTRGRWLTTFAPPQGADATGRLTSTPFLLLGDVMALRVGGGSDVSRVRVSLVVDDQVVVSAAGHDSGFLSRVSWDIAPYFGNTATLEIVDAADGAWGFLLVDEVTQWKLKR